MAKELSKITENKRFPNIDLDKLNSEDLGNVLKKLIESKKEYEIAKEQEATKRMAIENNMVQYLKTLEAKKEFLSKAFAEEYNIRKDTINEMFNVIERALDEDKDSIVIAALDNIEKVVKESPLKGIAQIANAFENDDEELVL